MPLTNGQRLGAYEILGQLGVGGMGEVYRARDTRLDREVAIKVLPQEVTDDAAALARFEREAKAVAALSHPNILAIHDFGKEDGAVYAVTELLDGDTLRERLDEARGDVAKVNEWAANFFQRNLCNETLGASTRQYLEGRQIPEGGEPLYESMRAEMDAFREREARAAARYLFP